MKKLLAVILAALLVTSLLTVGTFAAESVRTFAADEWDAVTYGFMAEAFEKRGLGATKSPSPGLGVNFFAKSWVEGYDDSLIWNVVDGNGYEIYKKTNQLTQKTGVDRMFGGNWIGAVNADVPFCQFPINIDVDLNGKRDISGVRIYKAATNNGYIKGYKVYVNYGGQDNGWHYIYSGNTSSKADLTADFGFNVTAAKVRISVTDISRTTQSAITSSGGEYTIPAGTPIYFFIDGVTVLKQREDYKNATVEQKDDEIAIDAAKLTGYQGGKVSEGIKQLMDGNIGKKVILNGNTTLDFGQQVTFSGFRYYPHVGATANDVVKSFGIDGGVKIYSKLGDEGSADTLLANAERISLSKADIDYTAADGGTDYTQPIDVDFGKNVTARGINFNIWHVPGIIEAASPYAGEIRLLAAKDYSHGYALKDDVIEFGVTPEVIDKGASKAGAGFVWNNPSCLFDGVIPIKDGDFGIDKNSSTYYVGFGTYGADAGFMSGEKAWLTIDLKQETEFSAVRLFGRMCYAMSPTDVNLYFSNDNEKWTLASHNTDSLTNKKIDDMFCYTKSGDIYTDMKPNDGENDYSVRARYIKIEILKAGNSDYATLSEIMLVKPGAEVLTCDALNEKILKNSVKTAIKTVQSGVLDGTESGIIRFITEFIKVGAEVEYFGTYAIGDAGAPNFGETSDASVNTAVYDVGKDGLSQPVAGNTYSVDITDIPSTKFDVPVYAVSFVKIKGYDNLILSEVKTGVTVDKDMNLKTAVTAEDGE